MEGKICISCKKRVVNDTGSATFKCPSCSDYSVVRCSFCRVNAVKYECASCHFIGPN